MAHAIFGHTYGKIVFLFIRNPNLTGHSFLSDQPIALSVYFFKLYDACRGLRRELD